MAKILDKKSDKYAGEAKVFDCLEKNLPDSIIGYYNREVNGHEFDFCILVKNLGLMIIEVKGWNAEHIVAVKSPNEIYLKDYPNAVSSPKKQANAYRFALLNMLNSQETMLIFEEIGLSTRLQPFALAKIAIAMSIRNEEKLTTDEFLSDTDGLELNRQTISGEYDDLFKALIVQHENKLLTDDEYFPKYLKAHLDRGAKLLYSEFKYSGSRFYQHLTNLDKSI